MELAEAVAVRRRDAIPSARAAAAAFAGRTAAANVAGPAPRAAAADAVGHAPRAAAADVVGHAPRAAAADAVGHAPRAAAADAVGHAPRAAAADVVGHAPRAAAADAVGPAPRAAAADVVGPAPAAAAADLAAPRQPSLMKRVMVPLCAMYGVYTVIAYVITLTVVVLDYQEHLARKALQKEQLLNASAAARPTFNTSVSGWGSATDLDASSAGDTFQDPRNYSSPNATGVDGGDTALFFDAIDHFLSNHSSVNESTSVLDSYNNSINLLEPVVQVNFSSTSSSAGEGDMSTVNVDVSSDEEGVSNGIFATGTNGSVITLGSLDQDHAVNTSFKVVQRTDGVQGGQRPSNLKDIKGLRTDPTVPLPKNATVSAESTNTTMISGSSNNSASSFNAQDGVGDYDAIHEDVGGSRFVNASIISLDTALYPLTEGDSLHSEDSSVNTTYGIDGQREIVQFSNTTDGVPSNYSSSNTSKLGVNETNTPLGTVDGITNSDFSFNTSTSGLGTTSELLTWFSDTIGEALNNSSSNAGAIHEDVGGPRLNVSVDVTDDSNNVFNVLSNYSSNASTFAVNATNRLSVAPLETIFGKAFNKSTSNNSATGLNTDLTTKTVQNPQNFSSVIAAASDDVTVVPDPPNTEHRLPFNNSVEELIGDLGTPNSTIDIPVDYLSPNKTAAGTYFTPEAAAESSGAADVTEIHNSSDIAHEVAAPDAITSRPSSMEEEWTTGNAPSEVAPFAFKENISSSNAASNSTVGANNEGESSASVNIVPGAANSEDRVDVGGAPPTTVAGEAVASPVAPSESTAVSPVVLNASEAAVSPFTLNASEAAVSSFTPNASEAVASPVALTASKGTVSPDTLTATKSSVSPVALNTNEAAVSSDALHASEAAVSSFALNASGAAVSPGTLTASKATVSPVALNASEATVSPVALHTSEASVSLDAFAASEATVSPFTLNASDAADSPIVLTASKAAVSPVALNASAAAVSPDSRTIVKAAVIPVALNTSEESVSPVALTASEVADSLVAPSIVKAAVSPVTLNASEATVSPVALTTTEAAVSSVAPAARPDNGEVLPSAPAPLSSEPLDQPQT